MSLMAVGLSLAYLDAKLAVNQTPTRKQANTTRKERNAEKNLNVNMTTRKQVTRLFRTDDLIS